MCLEGDAPIIACDLLRDMILDDPESLDLYVHYLSDSISLRCVVSSPIDSKAMALALAGDAPFDIPATLPAVLPPQDISLTFGSSSPAFHNTFGYFSSGWAAAYLVATVIFGIGLAIGAITHVSQPTQVASHVPATEKAPSPNDRAMEVVGRITGMADCRWGDLRTKAVNGGDVPLGSRYVLASGLMQITYNTGSTVLLQGPVTYEVESKNGGFMACGTLTGKVSTEESRGLTIRTPTATVVDMGTEFGVFVSADQTSTVRVFAGAVEVQSSGAPADRKRKRIGIQRLTAGEAARFAADGTVRPMTDRSNDTSFARELPKSAMTTGLRHKLAAYWSFDDPANLGKNAMGGGDLASVNSPEYETAGLLGGSVRLHGVARRDVLLYNEGRRVPNNVPTGGSSYSISVWFRTKSIHNGGCCTGIMGWGSCGRGQGNVLTLRKEDGNECVNTYWMDYDLNGFVPNGTIEGNWHHAVVTYDAHSGLQRLFLDGRWLNSRGSSDRPNVVPNNFAIGRGYIESNNLPQFFAGLLDEVGIWGRDLSTAEVVALYNGGKGLNPLGKLDSSKEAVAGITPGPQESKKGALGKDHQ